MLMRKPNRSGPVERLLLSPAWRSLRLVALRRDGYRCVICGTSVAGKGMARVDHILPRSTHPHLALVLSNCRTLCTRCDNQSHGEKRLPPHLRTGQRIERITGSNRSGLPIDPNHHWNR